MIRRLMLALVPALSLVLAGVPVQAQWSKMSIVQRYDHDHWVRDHGNGYYTTENGLTSLDPSNFNNQTLGEQHVQSTDSGDWLIMSYGDNNLAEQTVCDQIYVVTRHANGSYSIPANSALAYPPVPNPKPPPPYLQCKDYLGAGAGIAKTPSATGTGYKYFAILPVTDAQYHHAWVTWAVSKDGQNWSFPAQGLRGTTSDPRQSLQLIRRADLQDNNSNGTNHFWHIAMVYNKYDGFFYVTLGYANEVGIAVTWWRISFDPNNAWGLKVRTPLPQLTYEVQRRSGAGYVVTDGIIPTDDSWVNNAQDPKPQGDLPPVDPMDIVQLYKPDGTFDSMLFIYQPLRGFGQNPDTIAYVKGTADGKHGKYSGDFEWTTPQTLTSADLAKVYDNKLYASCKIRQAPDSLAVNQSGWQADGSPQLYGFIVASPYPCPSLGLQGLLMLQFSLSK